MLSNDHEKAREIVEHLSDHSETFSHERHIHIEECEKLGLNIIHLEDLQKEKNLQDAVLSAHHAFMITFSSTQVIKIVENQMGKAVIKNG